MGRYVIFVNDARKGETFKDGFTSGYYARRDGENVLRTFPDAFCYHADTIAGATKMIDDLGLTNSTGVHAGKLTAYVAWANL